MDKHVLREIISRTAPEQDIGILFRGSQRATDFTIQKKSVGRGKGGSLLLHLVNKETNEVVVVGTPDSEKILGVQHEGMFWGTTNEREDLPPAEPRPEIAAAIKAMMRPVIGTENERRVMIVSPFLDLNGVFTVASAKLANGKFGQVRITLTFSPDDDQEKYDITIWSYKHSGLIDHFQLLPDENSVPSSVSYRP
ncbi:MAG: hypothetical protein E6R04_01875 [Spirochaetes bacterium]|nr:MAG: hypothetical protein E6R04_01875 [Spirochaetota bacterium]